MGIKYVQNIYYIYIYKCSKKSNKNIYYIYFKYISDNIYL